MFKLTIFFILSLLTLSEQKNDLGNDELNSMDYSIDWSTTNNPSGKAYDFDNIDWEQFKLDS